MRGNRRQRLVEVARAGSLLGRRPFGRVERPGLGACTSAGPIMLRYFSSSSVLRCFGVGR